jgi:hypothetical protein
VDSIGGCAPNPRLLFRTSRAISFLEVVEPDDSDQT